MLEEGDPGTVIWTYSGQMHIRSVGFFEKIRWLGKLAFAMFRREY